jgi:glycosyltransferase involved in cell wall biosynthesis
VKKRILFTINNLDTAGMKLVLAATVTGLNKNVFEPIVVVNKLSGSELEKQIAAFCPVHEIMLRGNGFVKNITGALPRIKKLKALAGIAHSFDYSSDWYEGFLMKLAGIKYITEKTNLSFGSYRWKIKLFLADHIVCLSNAQATMLHKYRNKISVIPTGIEVSDFSGAVPASRADYGLQQSDIVLASVAHIVPVKGYEDLIEAVHSVKNKYPHLKILVIGRGDAAYEKLLIDKMNSLGIRDRFIMIGNSDNVASLLKMCDGKILATRNTGRREAFGAAIIEAMAAGLPVIATRSGGPDEIVLHNETGWLVDASGCNGLVEGIELFMASRDSWKQIGLNGYNRVLAHYQKFQMIQALEKLYIKVSPS